MSFTNPQYLVETDWLSANLSDPNLRILDATVFLHRPAEPGAPLVRESGLANWQAGHIPNSDFADLTVDLADPHTHLPYMMPPIDQFAAGMERLGVGEGTRVICYDAVSNMWGARLWWMLRAAGFDNAAVLNGGLRRWTAEGRSLSTDPAPQRPKGRFVARPRPGLFANKEEVLAEISNGRTCIINALTEAQHRGDDSAYGRPGRITGSVNVPAAGIVDPETWRYRDPDTLRAMFTAVRADQAERVITYCGGGIAASSDALVLTLLGYQNVAVYDGSLSEWARDEKLPMEVG